MNYKEFFGCKYPIVVLAMNQVSDVGLAIAVAKSGGFPSLSLFNYTENDRLDVESLDKDLDKFIIAIKNSSIICSMPSCWLSSNRSLVDVLIKHKISHFELLVRPLNLRQRLDTYKILTELKRAHLRGVLLKVPDLSENISSHLEFIDAIVVKSVDGAGRSCNTGSTLDILRQAADKYTDIMCIPCGGVYTKSQVDLLLANGALAVGVGTPFALSEESCIPTHTKHQMIQNNNLKNMQGVVDIVGVVNQNAIIFDKIDQPDDCNNTRSLKIGIATGQHGHVFAGSAIKSITTIESVQKIMMRLTHD